MVSTFDVDPHHRITGYLFFARIDRDFIAKEAKYHLKYRSSLKNCHRSHVRKLNQEEENIRRDEERMIESKVFEKSEQM